MNPKTQEKVAEQQSQATRLDRAMHLWITGAAGPVEAGLCWDYIVKQYGTRPVTRLDNNGAADPVAMAIAAGAQNVYLDIKRRAEDGAVVK